MGKAPAITDEFSTLFSEFERHHVLKHRKSKSSAAYVRQATLQLAKHLQEDAAVLSSSPLFEVNLQEVERFLFEVKCHVKPGVRTSLASRLRYFFSFLVDQKGLPSSPVGAVSAQRMAPVYDRYTDEEVRTIFTLIVDEESQRWIAARDYVVLSLYYEHRLTGGQVERITANDFDGRTLRVSAKGVRDVIELSDPIRRALKDYLANLPISLEGDDVLFRSQTGFWPLRSVSHIVALNRRTKIHGITTSIPKLQNSSPFFDAKHADWFKLQPHDEVGLTSELVLSFRGKHTRWWP